MSNTEKIKRRIRELGVTRQECANYIGIKTSVFSQKLYNIRSFNLAEVEKLATFLSISNSEYSDYFFKNSCKLQFRSVTHVASCNIASPPTKQYNGNWRRFRNLLGVQGIHYRQHNYNKRYSLVNSKYA